MNKEKLEKTDKNLETLKDRRREAVRALPQFRGEVPSKNFIRQLPKVEVGEIFWVEMDGMSYVVANKKENGNLTIKALDEYATISTGITIYDMNKAIVSKEKLFRWKDEEEVKKLTERLQQWVDDRGNTYYLLYGRDIHYVSLIRNDGLLSAASTNTIFDTVQNVGNLISMDFNEADGNEAVEIWVRTKESPAELLYLLPYDRGLIFLGS